MYVYYIYWQVIKASEILLYRSNTIEILWDIVCVTDAQFNSQSLGFGGVFLKDQVFQVDHTLMMGRELKVIATVSVNESSIDRTIY